MKSAILNGKIITHLDRYDATHMVEKLEIEKSAHVSVQLQPQTGDVHVVSALLQV